MKFLAFISTLLISASAFASITDQIRFNGLPGQGLNVQYNTNDGVPVLGVATVEKTDGNGVICQRTNPVSPNPAYTYTCYVKSLSGAGAQAAYAGLPGTELNLTYSFNGTPSVGVSVKQKSASSGICREVTAANQAPAYSCYGMI